MAEPAPAAATESSASTSAHSALADEKLRAEIEKLRAEARRLHKDGFDVFLNWVKVVGSLVLGVGGVLTAATTYQYKKAEADTAVKERAAAQAELADLEKTLGDKHEELTLAQNQLTQTQQSLAKLRSVVDDLQSGAPKDDSARKRVLTTVAEVDRTAEELVAARVAAPPSVPVMAPHPKADMPNPAAGLFAPPPSAPQPMVLLFRSASSQDGRAGRAAEGLKKEGYDVSTRVGPDRLLPTTEVRYFHYPRDRAAAQKVLDSLHASSALRGGRISFVMDPSVKRTEYFEVRLGRDAYGP
jgi:hypothetical protein